MEADAGQARAGEGSVPDFALIVSAWAVLSEQVCPALVTLVKTARSWPERLTPNFHAR